METVDEDRRTDRGPTWLFDRGSRSSSPAVGGEFVVVAVGALFAIGGLYLLTELGGDIHWSTLLFTAFMDVGLACGAILGGVLLRRSSFTPIERWIAARWYLGGLAFIAVLLVWASLPDLLEGASLMAFADEFVLFGNLGGIMGLLAGFNRARAAQNRRLVSEVRNRREQLEFVNHLLRHNILNSVQAIDGYASLLEADVDDSEADYLSRIEESSRRISGLIEDVRTLMRTLKEDVDRRPVNLSAILRREVALARDVHESATFHADIESDVVVEGDAILGAVFENLLDNAVVHHDGTHPEIAVSLAVESDEAVVRIADDGPGIPEDVRRQYLGRDRDEEDVDGSGLGLYLASVLVGVFDGDVSIADNDPRGAVVTITLPTAAEAA